MQLYSELRSGESQKSQKNKRANPNRANVATAQLLSPIFRQNRGEPLDPLQQYAEQLALMPHIDPDAVRELERYLQ